MIGRTPPFRDLSLRLLLDNTSELRVSAILARAAYVFHEKCRFVDRWSFHNLVWLPSTRTGANGTDSVSR